MLSSGESSPSSTWSFSMELLSHVHTLRVFLLPSSSQVQPTQDFSIFEATLLSAPPVLSCSWKMAGDAATHSLRLPLPILLFDYSSPPHVSALIDCVQLSVHLLPLPPLHLLSFRSVTASPDVSAHAANQAGFDAFNNGKRTQCEDDDDTGQKTSGTSLHCATVIDNGTHYDEHDCTQRHMLSTDGSIHCVVNCKMEDIPRILQGPPCDADRYGSSNDVNQANKGIGHIQSGHMGSSMHNNSTCDTIEMNRNDTCLGVGEVCPNVIHPDGNGCSLDRSMQEEFSKEESTVHRCPTSYIGVGVERSENSSLCQHTQFAQQVHGQCDDFPSNIFSSKNGSQDHGLQLTATFVCKNCLTKISKEPVRIGSIRASQNVLPGLLAQTV
ncbi:hypothetical protein L7F22_046644 [Adiantum nelumboides]|nr:hypothetical protein [Adiantum nelumboides]